jgi:hypothetical protein
MTPSGSIFGVPRGSPNQLKNGKNASRKASETRPFKKKFRWDGTGGYFSEFDSDLGLRGGSGRPRGTIFGRFWVFETPYRMRDFHLGPATAKLPTTPLELHLRLGTPHKRGAAAWALPIESAAPRLRPRRDKSQGRLSLPDFRQTNTASLMLWLGVWISKTPETSKIATPPTRKRRFPLSGCSKPQAWRLATSHRPCRCRVFGFPGGA